jgi:hypothetical protein
MEIRGPIITLLAGLLVATVLTVMNISVPNRQTSTSSAASSTASTPTSVPTSLAPAPYGAATQPAAVGTQVTYAGTVSGNGATSGNRATLAIVIKDGKAIAYLCDGRSTDAWMQGTATGGMLNLTGAKATLTGTVGNGVAAGTVSSAGRQFPFSLKPVDPPSGLYRATATVHNTQLVGGWVVLDNGEQVGLIVLSGQAQPAPRLDTTSKTVVVNGLTVAVGPVDGSGL